MAEAPHPIDSVDAHGCPVKEAEAPSPPLFQNGVLTFQGVYREKMCVTIFLTINYNYLAHHVRVPPLTVQGSAQSALR